MMIVLYLYENMLCTLQKGSKVDGVAGVNRQLDADSPSG